MLKYSFNAMGIADCVTEDARGDPKSSVLSGCCADSTCDAMLRASTEANQMREARNA